MYDALTKRYYIRILNEVSPSDALSSQAKHSK